MPPTYLTRISALERCGEDVVIASVELPEEYAYRAGQWFRLTLQSAEGPQTRTLSHAAAPADGVIDFATRLSPSPFKQALAQLSVGDTVEVSAPGGRLQLPSSPGPVCFLAGGVGLTPVRSLLRQMLADGGRLPDSVLLYGNRDETCIPYRADAESFAAASVSVVHVLERPPADWDGESGFITSEMISRYAPGGERTYFISGPPIMVAVMELILDELSVPGQARIIERFGPTAEAASKPVTSGRI